jgi:hypothetical protein
VSGKNNEVSRMTDIHIHLDGGKVGEKKKAGKKKAKKKSGMFSGPAGFGERAASKMFGW